MEQEEWKDVSDHFLNHEKYECSNTGFVRNKKNKRKLSVNRRLSNGYIHAQLGAKGGDYLVHRIIGETWIPNPENLPTLDHINGKNISDNSIWNLRWATYHQQSLNQVAYSKSGSKGVRQRRENGRWQARISINPETGKEETIGTFATKEEAEQAFNKRYIEIHTKQHIFPCFEQL